MRALAAAVLLAVASAANGAPSAPAPDAVTVQAKAHFKRGSELYRQARYREAIAEFEEANRLRPHGVIFYNLAQCHERLGDLAAALRAYHEYVRAVPQADDLASVNAAMANLEARLGASGVQQLLVYTDPPDAEVYVDGLARGRTPFAAVLPHGAHQLRLVKPGYVTIARDALLTSDRSLEIDVALKVVPTSSSTPLSTSTSTATSLSTSTSTPPLTSPSTAKPNLAAGERTAAALSVAMPPPAAKPAARGSRVWTWVAAGGAVAALAAGAAYGLSAHSASADLHSSVHDAATAQRLADASASRARTANVLYAVGAAAGTAGVALFFFEGTF